MCFQNKFTGEDIVDNSKLEGKQRAEFYKKQLETCLFRFEYVDDNISEKYKCKTAENIFGNQEKERYFVKIKFRDIKELHSKYCRGLDENFVLRKLNPVDSCMGLKSKRTMKKYY